MLDLDALHRHVKVLQKGDDAERRQAIHSLNEIDEQDWSSAPTQVVHSLVESLRHEFRRETTQPLVRREIVTALGKIGPRSAPAVPELIELLQARNPDGIREAAAAALGRIGPRASAAINELIELLASCRPALAIKAVQAISQIGCADEDRRTKLVDFWRSSNQSQCTQTAVAIALCKLKIDVRGLVPSLTYAVVANQDVAVRKLAAEALAWCRKAETDVVPGLLRASLSDKNEDVRKRAEASLAQLGLSNEKAIQACTEQLVDSAHAETALRHTGEQAVPALVKALGSTEPATREKAARILGSIGELAAPAVPALRKALLHTNRDFRLAAAKTLWMITKDAAAATPVLVGLLREDWSTGPDAAESRRRSLQTIIEALRRMGPPAAEAVPALVEKSKDKNRMISESALAALREIAPAGATKAR